MLRAKTLYCGLALALLSNLFFSGCNNSEYMMQDPDVLSGYVYTGAPVSGTVYTISAKRFDEYQCPIDPATGWYSITIKQPDGPYLIWAELDNSKIYFTYTQGIRISPDEARDELESNRTGGVYTHTANINPMTDLVLGLAYLSEPQTLFSQTTSKYKPDANRVQYLTEDLYDYLGPTLEYIGLNEDADVDDYYDFIAEDFPLNSDYTFLLGLLKIKYSDDDESRKVRLGIKDEYLPEGYEDSEDFEFFAFDLDEDEFIEDTNTDDKGEDVLERLKTIEGFPVHDE